jgi:multidrug efflux pump subunit AcrB
VRHRIQHELDTEFLPQWRAQFPGASLRTVGEAESESEFLQEVLSLYAIALFLMYALIAVAFRSYWQPLIIMTAIPFGYLGAVLGHLAYDMPMTLFSYFGIGAASGVVINDNLVLMDRIATLRERGLSAVDAVLGAGVTRFRPILLTSVTTFIGLLPAMTDASIEAQFLQPTTIALAWGVAIATFVTLLLTPALYLVGEDVRGLLRRIGRGRRRVESMAPELN